MQFHDAHRHRPDPLMALLHNAQTDTGGIAETATKGEENLLPLNAHLLVPKSGYLDRNGPRVFTLQRPN